MMGGGGGGKKSKSERAFGGFIERRWRARLWVYPVGMSN